MKGTDKGGLLALLIITSTSLHAQDVSVIGNQAFQGANGKASVNMASGNFNQQDNSHAIGQMAHTAQLNQLAGNDLLGGDGDAMTAIESMAFAGFVGLLSVNQVSGDQNIQLNAGAISAMPASLEDGDLTLVSALSPGIDSGVLSNNQTHIAPDSLNQAQGVIQLNQISGDSNVAVNQFSLQLSGGN
ncbi:hypothetical protein L2750_01375 [Shewanella submarina]|uniref:Adhesin n=1 Tax=Shewanella submarina TaxID=2016376 RepID=A0ABV7GIL3_9GAMM|nr:hypothetical protein [Shewanella submarina]MCL1035809.1 hypothetical protein [Shewanella submarina]